MVVQALPSRGEMVGQPVLPCGKLKWLHDPYRLGKLNGYIPRAVSGTSKMLYEPPAILGSGYVVAIRHLWKTKEWELQGADHREQPGGGINGRYRSTECPCLRFQFQPLVQSFLHIAFVSPSWLGCSSILCTSVICWSVCTVVCWLPVPGDLLQIHPWVILI